MDLEGKFLQIIQVVIIVSLHYCSPPGAGAFSKGL